MPEFRELREIYHYWGGSNAVFFSYTHFSHDLCTGLLAALLPLIRDSLGLTYLQSGLLLSAFAITSGLSQLPWGWIGDRLSRHVVVAIGLGGVGLSALAIGLSSSYYVMLFILIVMGVVSGAYHPSATSMLSTYSGETKRGRAIALHMVGGSVGFTTGPILGGIIAGALGWHYSFIILSLLTVAAVPIVLRKFSHKKPVISSGTREETSASDNVPVQPVPERIGIIQVLRPVAAILILVILTELIVGASVSFIPLYLVDKHSVDPAYAAMLLGVVRGGGVAGSLLGGWLSDKWGRRNAVGLALVAGGPVLFLITRLPFNPVMIIVFFIFGTAMYLRQSTIQPLLMDSTPPYLRSTVFGIYFGLGMEGRSLAQPVAGYYMDIFGITEAFNVIALMCVGVALVALFLAIKNRKR